MSTGPTPDLEPGPGSRWLTLANALTLVRLLAIPVLVVAILERSAAVACLLFWLAVATDLLDGRIARWRGEQSNFGALFDHGTDALLCTAALGALAWIGIVPPPLPLLVAAAFTQYTLDSKALAGRPLRTSFIGRWNGIAYYVLAGIPLSRDALGVDWPPAIAVFFLGWLLVASTLISMMDRWQELRASRRRRRAAQAASQPKTKRK